MWGTEEELGMLFSALDSLKFPASVDLPIKQDGGGPEVGGPSGPLV